MCPYRETLLDICSTPMADLRREACGYSYNLMTSSRSLILKDTEKRAPTCVVNALSKMMVLYQSRYIQVFYTNTAISVRICFGCLEMEIAPLAGNLEMPLGDLLLGFASAVTAFLAAITETLCLAESFLPPSVVARVSYNGTFRVRQKHLQSHI